VTVGTGVWQGPVKSGPHRVEVMADGHVASSQNINVVPGKQQDVKVTLDRDLSNPMWHAGFATHPYAELVGGLAIAPTLGGDAERACNSNVVNPDGASKTGCASHSSGLGPLVGVRGGYEFAQGLGVELFFGYFSSSAKQTRRLMAAGDPSVTPTAGTPPPGVNAHDIYSSDYKDSTSLSAPFAALSVSYRFLEQTPITFRLWAGAARGSVTTSNSGTFAGFLNGTAFNSPLSIGETSQSVWMPILGPEARAGLRLSKSFSIDLGVALLWALPGSTPRNGDNTISNGNGRRGLVTTSTRSFIATLPKEDALGSFLTIAPTLGGRLDF
jgi:hypothetical protein